MSYSLDTEVLYQGTTPQGIIRNPETPAIYPASAYILDDMEDYLFADKGGRYYYNRSANPNRDELGAAVSFLEKGEKTLICSSGMAAISTVLLSLLKNGDNIVMSKAIYGETVEMAEWVLPGYGIEVTFADFTNPEEVTAAVKPNTKMLYTEIIANPLTGHRPGGHYGDRQREGHPHRRRQHLHHPLCLPAAGARRRHRPAQHDQVLRRAQRPDGRLRDSLRSADRQN